MEDSGIGLRKKVWAREWCGKPSPSHTWAIPGPWTRSYFITLLLDSDFQRHSPTLTSSLQSLLTALCIVSKGIFLKESHRIKSCCSQSKVLMLPLKAFDHLGILHHKPYIISTKSLTSSLKPSAPSLAYFKCRLLSEQLTPQRPRHVCFVCGHLTVIINTQFMCASWGKMSYFNLKDYVAILDTFFKKTPIILPSWHN